MTSSTAVAALIRAFRPEYASDHDKVVFAVHAVVLANGFTLVGVGEEDHDAVPPPDAPEVGIEGWNASQEVYTFRYVDSLGAKSAVLVKCLAVGKRLLVNFLALGGEAPPETATIDDVGEYTTESHDVIKGYKNFAGLVDRLASAFSAISLKATPLRERPGNKEVERPGNKEVERPGPDYRQGTVPLREPEMARPLASQQTPGFGVGGMMVGPHDPIFAGRVRHPHNVPDAPFGIGPRFDPIAPPGMPGSHPRDFQRLQGNSGNHAYFHPDIQQPGPHDFPWQDNMFG